MVLQPKDQRVKRLGDEILNHVRDWLDRECKNDPNLRFLVNRWVFSRLQLDYRQETQRVKKALMEHGMFECQGGGPHDGNLQVHRSMVNRSIFPEGFRRSEGLTGAISPQKRQGFVELVGMLSIVRRFILNCQPLNG